MPHDEPPTKVKIDCVRDGKCLQVILAATKVEGDLIAAYADACKVPIIESQGVIVRSRGLIEHSN